MNHKKIAKALGSNRVVELSKQSFDPIELLNGENLIREIIASKSRSQKGDISKHLVDQGFFEKGKPKGLDRDPLWSGGNPVDTLDDFLKQNPD